MKIPGKLPGKTYCIIEILTVYHLLLELCGESVIAHSGTRMERWAHPCGISLSVSQHRTEL